MRALRRCGPQWTVTEEQSTGRHGHRQQHVLRAGAYQPFLDELLAHWNDTYAPDATFSFPTPDDAVAFFRGYQRALGEDPDLTPGHAVTGFVRSHPPGREEILLFMRAYQYPRRGNRTAAAQGFQRLARSRSQFADPWVWLSATAVESAPTAERRTFQVSQVTYQLVLLPVWMAILESRRGRSLALANGQTGAAALGSLLSGASLE